MTWLSTVRVSVCIFFGIVGILCAAQGQPLTIEQFRRKIISVDKIVAEFETLKRDPQYLAQQRDLRAKIKAELSALYVRSASDPLFSLGALNVRDMFARFEKVYIGWNMLSLPMQADLERDSDFYLPGHGLAILNTDFERASPIGRFGVLLHVTFGASGFDDEKYQLTLASLIADAQMRNHSLYKNVNIQRLFPSTSQQLAYRVPQGDRRIIEFFGDANQRVIVAENRRKDLEVGGGYTGVGGGGDSSAYTVKHEMIKINPVTEKLLNPKVAAKCIQAWQDYTTYLLDVLNVPMESMVGSRNVHMLHSDKGRSICVPKTYGYSNEAMRDLAEQGIEVLCRNKYLLPVW